SVNVAPGAARGQVRVVVHPRPGGDVHEAPAALAVGLVVVEDNAAQVGHGQVVEAVVVEVADRTAQAEAGAGHARLVRDGGGGAVAVVPVQLVGGPGPRARPDRAVLDDEQVRPTIVVVIDPAEAAAEGLVDVVRGGVAVEMPERDPARPGGAHKPGKA